MNQRTVLVTGASTGIGRACALALVQLGFEVFAGVRKESDGTALIAAANPSGAKLIPVRLDVTDAESIAAAASQITDHVGQQGLTALINNAGICVTGPVEFVSLEEWRRQFEVNFFGAIAVTQAVLPLLRVYAATHGLGSARLVNMSSIAGKIGQPILGPYTASKHAMESLTDSLRMELRAQGIVVCSINPGPIDTPIWDKGFANSTPIPDDQPVRLLYGELIDGIMTAAKKAQADAVPASEVVKAVVDCLNKRRPRTRYFVGKEARSGAMAKWLLPDRIFDALFARMIRVRR